MIMKRLAPQFSYMNNEQRISQLEKLVADQDRVIRQLSSDLQEITKYNTATRFTFKDVVVFESGTKVGFYGKDPVKQQSLASDTLANLLTALRTLGIIA
jgi:hypothetical protein